MKNYTYDKLLNELNEGSPRDFWIMLWDYLMDLNDDDYDAVDEAMAMYMEMSHDDFKECISNIYDMNNDNTVLAFRNCIWAN